MYSVWHYSPFHSSRALLHWFSARPTQWTKTGPSFLWISWHQCSLNFQRNVSSSLSPPHTWMHCALGFPKEPNFIWQIPNHHLEQQSAMINLASSAIKKDEQGEILFNVSKKATNCFLKFIHQVWPLPCLRKQFSSMGLTYFLHFWKPPKPRVHWCWQKMLQHPFKLFPSDNVNSSFHQGQSQKWLTY